MKNWNLIPDLAINSLAVTHAEKQYDSSIIFNCANGPVVPHPVSPEISQKRALHCFPDGTWITQLGYAFVEKFEDATGVSCVKLGQFALSGRRNFNPPSHVAS